MYKREKGMFCNEVMRRIFQMFKARLTIIRAMVEICNKTCDLEQLQALTKKG